MRAGIVWSLVSCCLVACALPPRPRVPLPKSWAAPLPAAVSDAVAGQPGERSLWKRFHSPELEQLLQAAAQHSFDNVAAKARVSQQRALARLARAALFPTLSLEAAASAQSTNSKTLGTVSGAFFDAGASLQYEIDLWGVNNRQAQSAAMRGDAADKSRVQTELGVTVGVAQAYFEVLSLRERMARAKDNFDATERILGVVEARARAGGALAREVAQQRTLVAAEAARLDLIEQAEGQARLTLAIASGREPTTVVVHGENLDAVTDPVLTTVDVADPERLLSRRPDVMEAELLLRASDADALAARRFLWPSLRVSASAAWQSTLASDVGRNSTFVYAGVLGLSQPVFDGGANAARRDAARALANESVALYRRTVLQAIGEVSQALRALDGLQKQHRRQQVVVEESRRAFGLVESEYRAGATDLLAVLDAQRTLIEAEDQFSQLRLSKLRAAVALIQALGGSPTDAR